MGAITRRLRSKITHYLDRTAGDAAISPRDRMEALEFLMKFYEGRSVSTMLGSRYCEREEESKMYWR